MDCQETETERNEHLWVLALAVGAIALSLIVQPGTSSGLELSVPGLATRVPLPDACLSQRALGVSCPGCGLGRSFVAVARWDFTQAVRFNPLGPILYFICVLQIPYRLVEYFGVCQDSRWWNAINGRLSLVTWFILAGLIGQWLVRMIES